MSIIRICFALLIVRPVSPAVSAPIGLLVLSSVPSWAETSNGGVGLKSFQAPDLYAEGGQADPGDEHEHWTSEPLQASRHLQYVSFRWRDQGFGYRKGRLYLRLVSSSPTTGTSAEGGLSQDQDNGHRHLMPDAAPHEWTRVVVGVYPEDPLRRLARAGDRYCLSYFVGGGGGHSLHATGFTLHFGGRSGFLVC